MKSWPKRPPKLAAVRSSLLQKHEPWSIGRTHFWSEIRLNMVLIHKGCVGPWALFWALKKALKRVNPLKKTLLRANPLFWVLKKVFKKVSLIKRALKKVLFWVINSKKCSKKSGLLKKVKFESSAQKRAHLSWTPQKNAQKSGLH